MEQILNLYYKNNAKKLHSVVNKIFDKKYGGIKKRDMDEFYSVANDVFADIIKHDRYDSSKGDFDGFLYKALSLAIVDEFKKQNREKRKTKINLLDENGNKVLDKDGKAIKISVPDVYLDAPIKEDSGMTHGDMVQSDFNLDNMLLQKGIYQDEKIDVYLKSLPKLTRQIIQMKMNDFPVSEIKNKLGITEKEYSNCMKAARMNENISLFMKQSNRYKEEYNKMENVIPIDVTDNYRMDKFPLGALLDDMRDGKINKKHILQRKPFQWTERQKNKFLTRVLNGQPIPEIVICEQTVKGKKKSHLIDGLQRLSYSDLFRADGIVVKIDGAEFYEIPYKEYKYDKDGKVLMDEDGDALFEEKIFNVIGKKFSEFPKFLKDRFNKFNINVTTYFNCTDEQIAYHIRNYNNQEGMNKSQYEFTGIDIDVANQIKNISENHSFFKDCYGKYTEKNKIKGDVDKIVVESIMSINFIDNWKKDVKDSYSYINEHVTDNMFDSLRDTLDQLCRIVDKEIKPVFTTTNSPVWFAVFDKFKTLDLPLERFKEFIKYVNESMDTLELEGELFINTYKNKNTRDKKIVTKKINGLISIMYNFLHIEKSDDKTVDVVTFISENVGINKETVKDNLEVYIETLNDLKDQTIKYGSKLLNQQNEISLLGMVAYSYETDQDLDNWLTDYAAENNTYFTDQKKNFIHMKEDFKQYCKKNRKSA